MTTLSVITSEFYSRVHGVPFVQTSIGRSQLRPGVITLLQLHYYYLLLLNTVPPLYLGYYAGNLGEISRRYVEREKPLQIEKKLVDGSRDRLKNSTGEVSARNNNNNGCRALISSSRHLLIVLLFTAVRT